MKDINLKIKGYYQMKFKQIRISFRYFFSIFIIKNTNEIIEIFSDIIPVGANINET